jgi:hypothetical protein
MEDDTSAFTSALFLEKNFITITQRKGFSVTGITYPTVHRSIKQIFYSLFMLEKKPGPMIQTIYDVIPEQLAIPINTYDIMFVMAVKV